jgi:hypothetical protein
MIATDLTDGGRDDDTDEEQNRGLEDGGDNE